MSRLATASRRNRFVSLRTAGSPPVALHPASRRRSYLRLRSLRPAPARTRTVLTKRPHGRTHPRESGDPGDQHGCVCSWVPACEDVIQSPPGVFGFGNGHLKREFAACGITNSPRDRKRSPRPPSDFGVGRRLAENRDWITSPCAGMTTVPLMRGNATSVSSSAGRPLPAGVNSQ